ncbi:restriction endonuclease subunit S [Vibrio aestuarianus]|uniref:restriction endonuclease subunit S n=1 Tax=Vibrio aestuarianus TaxID=28171 RepID=UPI00237CB4BD|nr:restriction endonuclease subunit S [Vibrio aestuarianus]MDE1333870.1 restriction endonuclease subunit S [Vibrio aestuarianus]
MSELPRGWFETTLGDVATWSSGGTPSRKNKDYYNGNIPWIKTGDLGVQYLEQASEYISDEGLKNSSAKLFPKNTVAIAMYGATIGKTSILNFEATTNQACGVAIPNASLSTVFLYYLLRNEKEGFIARGKGGAQPNISQTIIKEYSIWLPPLNEQIRIANKLDSILAKVDKAQARLDKIPAILKRFRQSVLAAATSGELTKEWREELGIEWSNNVFTVEQIAKKEKYSLGIGPFGSNLKVADYRSEGHPLVFVREIRARQFGGADTKFVEHGKFTELAAHRVKPGNILITKMGDPPGDVAIYPDDCAEAVITSDCIKLDVNEELINKQFVFHYMQSEHFQSQMRAITAGVAQQKVNLKNFKGLTLLAPTMDEQIEINRIISGLMDRADRVEKQYLDAKARLDRLTQSILAKAFRGELVPQDPNDEPAEKLLERILAEKEQNQPKKATRKRATKAKTAEKE